MFLPVQDKPKSIIDYSRVVLEIPNIITIDMAMTLRNYALSGDSGWHHRGSKTPEVCNASFHTCLVYRNEDPIYKILDIAWKQYCETIKHNITFVEPYEIKSYSIGDQFQNHNDILYNDDFTLERRVNLVVQLSDSTDYGGGNLFVGPVHCSREFGTGIFFPAEYTHQVTQVSSGIRFSLIGHAWGPIRQ